MKTGIIGGLGTEGEGRAGGEGHLLLLVAGGIAEDHRGGAGEVAAERHLGHLPLAPAAVHLHAATGAESAVAAGVPEVRQGGEELDHPLVALKEHLGDAGGAAEVAVDLEGLSLIHI